LQDRRGDRPFPGRSVGEELGPIWLTKIRYSSLQTFRFFLSLYLVLIVDDFNSLIAASKGEPQNTPKAG
jgi:hypothetical protein